ncbi:FAD-binding protein [bacterium]|nr:FAD-binding protein [bacterium]
MVKSKILSSAEERYCYAQDAANLRNEPNLPDAVVFVETIEEVQSIVKYANSHKIPIISRGAGTNMVGACTCTQGGIVLNFSRMNKIVDFNTENMTMKVQPGVILDDIKKLAESKGLFYPPDPSSYKVSTIGGSIAQSSGGAKTFKYGTTKDYILSLTVVLADGTLMKLGSGTVKDAVGYHLNQLIIGSEGTLAIVVEAELKLIPLPDCSILVSAYFDTIESAIMGVNDIIKNRIFPSTIDFMDKNAINSVEQFYPCGLQTDKSCMLLIEVDGFKKFAEFESGMIQDILKVSGASYINVAEDETAKENIWTARRSSFAATAKLGLDVVSDDVIVPRNALLRMINGCIDICNKFNLKLCLVGHIGDGNLHPQIALNLENDEEFKSYMSAKSEIYKLALSLGGTISSEHGVGIEKLSYIEQTVGAEVLEQMKRIKLLFDPNNILNPGKIFNL